MWRCLESSMNLGGCGSHKQKLRVEARRVDELFWGEEGSQANTYIYINTHMYVYMNSKDIVLKV